MSATLPPAPRCPCDRAGLPVGAERCLMCDLDDAQGPTVFRAARSDARAWSVPALVRCPRCHGHYPAGLVEEPCPGCAARLPDAPTFRPPADQRCSRCDRILLSAPCGCLTPVETYLRAADARDAAWAALTSAERIEAIKARAAT